MWEQLPPRGHACPSCFEPLRSARGVNREGIENAVLAYLNVADPTKARQLRTLLDGRFEVSLAAW